MMTKRIIGVVAVVAIVAVAALAYAFLRPPEEASAPIEAIPLSASAPEVSTAAATSAPEPPADATATPAEATDTPAEITAAPAATDAPAEATSAPEAIEPVLLRIAQDQSEARFTIDEVLNGNPITVLGTTNQVAGEIAVDANDPAGTRVGTIQINARTLTTDNEYRNRAIKNRILMTDQYEFITFVPTEISGLPSSGAIGESYNFQMTGDLTIRDVTQPVTFDVTVQPTSKTQLTGTATATIRHADFNLSIPEVPSVASVAETVGLELVFVALTG